MKIGKRKKLFLTEGGKYHFYLFLAKIEGNNFLFWLIILYVRLGVKVNIGSQFAIYCTTHE